MAPPDKYRQENNKDQAEDRDETDRYWIEGVDFTHRLSPARAFVLKDVCLDVDDGSCCEMNTR